MANQCPLLIHPSFIGRTYHDFRLNFQPSPGNCSLDLLLIQFTRMINATFNHTSYSLYNPAEPNHYPSNLQVLPNDRVNLCIRSTVDTDHTCYEFYMITILSSINSSIWPLLIIFAYITVLLIAMLASSISKLYSTFSRTIFSGSVTKRLLKNRNQRSISVLLNPQKQKKKANEKKEIFKAIQFIAQDCQSSKKTKTFIIPTIKKEEHVNHAYLS